MNIKTISATTSEPDNPFTVDELKKLALSAPGVPICVDFDQSKPVGKVTAAEVVGDQLHITAIITVDCSGKYLVPGYELPTFKSVCYWITDYPLDKSIDAIPSFQ